MKKLMTKRLLALLLSALMMLGALPLAALGEGEEMHYIEPLYYQNVDGPTIGVTVKRAIMAEGLLFRDANGNGKLDPYEDWRLTDRERAEDLVTRMNIDEKLGMMTINSRGMGIYAKQTAMDGLLDEDFTVVDHSTFGPTPMLGTIEVIQKYGMRHHILRTNPSAKDLAMWINAMNQVAEATGNGIPVIVNSNSRNENAGFGSAGIPSFNKEDNGLAFSVWPGTLGLAAAAMGDIKAGGDAGLITQFSEMARKEWDAVGMKKAYMYMADVATDPRWQRTYGTLGERPDFVADAIARMVVGFQGSSEGLQDNGVGLTVKHFPGGGARENGYDPHYELGQYNPYATENSLELYHLAPFQAAVDNKVASIMPYYAIPYGEKSAPQSYQGKPLDLSVHAGFAFNKPFITDLLKDQMGFTGYINSDTGILGGTAWGMKEYDVPSRFAAAINAGTDIISGGSDFWSMKEAWRRGVEEADKYEPRFVLSEERINEANVNLLIEMFAAGLFENPYRDPQAAEELVAGTRNDPAAYEAHLKSVVLLKNEDNLLPLTAEKVEGKTVYVEYFNFSGDTAEMNKSLRSALIDRGMAVVGDYNKADYALLFVDPTTGSYSSATAGYLELDITENKDVVSVDEKGRPTSETHKETTLVGADRIAVISEAVQKNGGKVIANINLKIAMIPGNVEPYANALTAGFDTFVDATLDVIQGVYNPTGVLPLTLPKGDSVIAVDENGDCISPNDVPGYAKDLYMPEEMKDENGKAYAYRDAAGNYYESNYGLGF